jgi:tetratricopeptide (TPR) repeat protein
MAISEIEKLERRYAENPQGLTFAPLAEVHRKNGDLGRALDLLRPGLEHHPDYIPASIVLGRCHFDLGDLPAAEAAFDHVLVLDGENVIALKALADISERLSRFDDAERWLHTLLSVDRSNDEARSQLDRIEASRRQAELGSSANPEAARSLELLGETPEQAAAASAQVERLPEGETSEPMIAWVSDAGTKDTAEAPPLRLEDLTQESIPSVLEPMGGTEELDPRHPFLEPVEPLPGLVGRDQEDLEIGEEFKVETSEDIVLQSSGGGEFQVPDASEELIAGSPARPSPFEENAPLASTGYEPPSPFGVGTERADERAEKRTDEKAAEVVDGERPEPVEAPEKYDATLAEATRRWPAMGSSSEQPEAAVEPPPIEAASPATEKEEPAVEAVAPADQPAPEPEWQPSDATVTLPELVTSEFAPPAPETTTLEGSVPESTTSEPAEDSAPWQFSTSSPAPPAIIPESPSTERLTVPEPELVVTETMAEVLRNQGHSADALRVYRELETRSAGNPRLRQKIAELEEAARALVSAPRHTYLARETQGQSVAEFFRGLLTARPPAIASAPAAATPVPAQSIPEATGAPTRPATEALSLSAVFGEEGTPTPPAVPAPGAPAGSSVSYDEFFGGQTAAGSQRSSRTSDAKSDDLDQFHAWLQNLKR